MGIEIVFVVAEVISLSARPSNLIAPNRSDDGGSGRDDEG